VNPASPKTVRSRFSFPTQPIPTNHPFPELIFPALNLQPPTPRSRFWTNESTSIYIQPPSPQVDAAWDTLSLETLEMTTITASQARALGRDPSLLSGVPTSWGLGPDLYFAQVGVFHLIHCLDEIRKQMHYDYYHLSMFGKDPPVEFKNHKNHCVHVLLENLLCQASTDVVTHNWREGYTVPLADFHPEGRQCRNFDGLWEVAKERAIKDYRTGWRKLRPPEGAKILPAPTPRLYPPGGHHH
jgi:hypothetical protein